MNPPTTRRDAGSDVRLTFVLTVGGVTLVGSAGWRTTGGKTPRETKKLPGRAEESTPLVLGTDTRTSPTPSFRVEIHETVGGGSRAAPASLAQPTPRPPFPLELVLLRVWYSPVYHKPVAARKRFLTPHPHLRAPFHPKRRGGGRPPSSPNTTPPFRVETGIPPNRPQTSPKHFSVERLLCFTCTDSEPRPVGDCAEAALSGFFPVPPVGFHSKQGADGPL